MYRSFARLENEANEIIKKHPGAELQAVEVRRLLERIEGNYFPNKIDLYDYLNDWFKIGLATGYRMAKNEGIPLPRYFKTEK